MVVLTDSSPWKEAIAARNQRTSPLLKLPGELRNRIYGYVLGTPTWYVGNSHQKRDANDNVYEVFQLYEETQRGHYRTKPSFGPPLLGVSRQIHLEAWPLLYALSTFQVGHSRPFFIWIESLPDVARLAVSSVSLGEMTLKDHVDDPSVDFDLDDNDYPRTSFPPLDIHQVPAIQSHWDYNIFASLGDLYWKLPGLKHLRMTVRVYYGRYRQGFQYRRVEDEEMEAKLRPELAQVFALPDVHVDVEFVLYKS
ncbi:uncharacterized protein J4E87_009853 [Alternaria ethzedia]|uniref:uncharacterized protein n=1 Tax=Alternaria ethzedia TaxID=181014 RepID=UPI0020C4BD5F|nr:uncharacterized protein J4E87_009853 [Alternaria ethzedia]KAI4613386.1 hypothetical protein J4E87_009853 [Alternaria ethzedia]